MTNEEHMLRELLAVIHRDGGHHACEVGLKKSTLVAIDKIIQQRQVVETAFDLCTCKGRYHTEKKMLELMKHLNIENSYSKALEYLTSNEMMK